MIEKLKNKNETLWINPELESVSKVFSVDNYVITQNNLQEAKNRLDRFAPLFMQLFKDTIDTDGIVESPLVSIEKYQKTLIPFIGGHILGQWYLKLDSHLPISGSIKARGGVYEVIKLAEKLAKEAAIIDENRDYTQFLDQVFKILFAKYTIAVGSTGNLGLSIGIMGRALGFNVEVHMSKDAKPWKISELERVGANVKLYEADYSTAVLEGRKQAEQDVFCHFIDDENSLDLFEGYAVAALRLQKQLQALHIKINANHPLFIYLPCGVGGAPGGIGYALKMLYGDAVHLFFAEPTAAPCMLLGLMTKACEKISVLDIGLKIDTLADGLAVGRASKLVCNAMFHLLSGIYTVSDEKLLKMLYLMFVSENIALEPSALAGAIGPVKLFYESVGINYLSRLNLLDKAENITHISWATGGKLVPKDIMMADIVNGKHIDSFVL